MHQTSEVVSWVLCGVDGGSHWHWNGPLVKLGLEVELEAPIDPSFRKRRKSSCLSYLPVQTSWEEGHTVNPIINFSEGTKLSFDQLSSMETKNRLEKDGSYKN